MYKNQKECLYLVEQVEVEEHLMVQPLDEFDELVDDHL
jgi:hypothetical protein